MSDRQGSISHLVDFLQNPTSFIPVLLVVGNFGAGKSWLLRKVATETRTRLVNVNRFLAEKIHPDTPEDALGEHCAELYQDLLKDARTTPLLLDNLELLFQFPHLNFVVEAEHQMKGRHGRLVLALPCKVRADGVLLFDGQDTFDLSVNSRMERVLVLHKEAKHA